MNNICQRQLLIEYLRIYGKYLPDERMLEAFYTDAFDMDILKDFREEVIMTVKQIKDDFATKRGGHNNNVFYG